MKINNVPVICAECEHVKIIRVDYRTFLYCEKSGRYVFNAKPDWCPLPPLFEEEK